MTFTAQGMIFAAQGMIFAPKIVFANYLCSVVKNSKFDISGKI